MKRYYIVYNADCLNIGCADISTNEELDNFESINKIAKAIAEKNNFKNVIILSWKELRNE